ncbi:MAG: triose-phosphate isomerase, partial [Alphaproteobacteria bacterium]
MSDARTPLIAGNWKMNGMSAGGAELAAAISAGAGAVSAELLVCPPAVLMAPVSAALSAGVALGGQDCHVAESGAHTGDISAEMLADCGCAYVIVGHSERRADHGETSEQVCAKAAAAHRAGVRAVICVGETEAERDSGDTLAVISAQLSGSVPAGATATNTVVAYEPVWAIGTGRTPTNEEAQAVHAHIRTALVASHGAAVSAGMRLLYGGSMKPDNATGLLAQPDIDGGLIGGASLK